MMESHLAWVLKLKHLLIALEAPLSALGMERIPILTLAHMVSREAKQMDKFDDTNLDLPLWHNPMFPHILNFADHSFWENRGLVAIQDIYTGNVMASFMDLQRKYELPYTAFYRYLQLRHALQTQFGATSTKFSDYPLIGVLRSQGPKGLVSTIYSHLFATSLNTNFLEVRNNCKHLYPICQMRTGRKHASPI